MKNKDKISLSEWNELTDEEKETLRTWALKHGYELDLVPNNSGTFDPTCDYATLVTTKQMLNYLRKHNLKVPSSFHKKVNQNERYKVLWRIIVQQMR